MMLVFALLVVYQAKHFLCDYPLQRPWMLGKFKGGWAWVGPLAAHVKQQARAVLHSNRMFWNSLGIDQMVHHLTHYLIIWLLVH